jgi:hypothetical protein
MPKAAYPAKLQDPVKYNQRLNEWFDEGNSKIGEIKPWDIDERLTWRLTSRVATEDLIRLYDVGFLKKLSCQSRRIFPVGDCNWVKGKVTQKYILDGEHVVDLEITSTSQRGIMHMPGTATARLLSKADTVQRSSKSLE